MDTRVSELDEKGVDERSGQLVGGVAQCPQDDAHRDFPILCLDVGLRNGMLVQGWKMEEMQRATMHPISDPTDPATFPRRPKRRCGQSGSLAAAGPRQPLFAPIDQTHASSDFPSRRPLHRPARSPLPSLSVRPCHRLEDPAQRRKRPPAGWTLCQALPSHPPPTHPLLLRRRAQPAPPCVPRAGSTSPPVAWAACAAPSSRLRSISSRRACRAPCSGNRKLKQSRC